MFLNLYMSLPFVTIRTMYRQDFNYDLPEELIAQYPPAIRGESRLLCLDANTGDCRDRVFAALPGLLHSGDLLVFNDTRVLPARLHGHKETGGTVEILVERLLDEHRCLAQIRAGKATKPGTRITLEGGAVLHVAGREGEFFILCSEDNLTVNKMLEENGHIPLPPYIRRNDEAMDAERYQTVFARHKGAVAAPTAGLHFTHAMLNELKGGGIDIGFVTLHVGAGTFQPLRVDEIAAHKMHRERFTIAPVLCEQVEAARRRGGCVVAVGTTTVRALESAMRDGVLQAGSAETDMFIYPGYEFRLVDALITNFHLPESTLLMLVSAFAGTDKVLKAYEHAVRERYRFFSYGDAMLISFRQGLDAGGR